MSELNKGFMIINGQIIGATGEKVYSTSPIGTVLSYAGQTIPNGYLLADGASYLVKDISAGGENEKTVSFKVRKDYFASYYAKRTFLLSANVYSLGFSKPIIGLVEIYRGSADNYDGYVVNLEDTRYTGVTVTVNGDFLEVVVTFNSYESSGCMVSCSSLSNVPIA